MSYQDYGDALRRLTRHWRPGVSTRRLGMARTEAGPVPLWRVRSEPHEEGGLTIVSGFHGEEPAGPVALLTFMDHVLGRARTLDVPICIYPVMNPHGFDRTLRTTVDGHFTNAGFIHDLDPTSPEAALLQDDLLAAPPHVFLDLHEDDREPRAYLYAFGDPALARAVVDVTRLFLPVAEGPLGHSPSLVAVEGQLRDLHDGSSEDFMSHQPGVRASLAMETPSQRDLRLRVAVHVAVVDVCLEAVAASRAARRAGTPPG
jgi:predicted deacylase